MAHVRSQIRDAVVTALSGLAISVKASRTYSLTQGSDAALVYVPQDVVTQKAGPYIHRAATVLIEIFVNGKADTIDDTMDGHAVTVEVALAGSKLGGVAKDVQLQQTEIAFNGEGATPVGILRMTYQVRYATSEADPETAT